MNAIFWIALAFGCLLAVYALVTKALDTLQAWHHARFCRRETQQMRRFHEQAARHAQVVQSLAEWRR